MTAQIWKKQTYFLDAAITGSGDGFAQKDTFFTSKFGLVFIIHNYLCIDFNSESVIGQKLCVAKPGKKFLFRLKN